MPGLKNLPTEKEHYVNPYTFKTEKFSKDWIEKLRDISVSN